MIMMATLETFSQTGFQQALIQKKDNIESYLNSVWTVLILRSLVLFAILYFIAPFATIFFNVPQAKSIIQVIGFSILFQAFTNIGVIYFQKELEFNKHFIYRLSGTLADFIVAVSAALILRSVWALVFGVLAGEFVRCIVSYIIHPFRPHLSSDLGKAKELFGFGKWILGSSILVFLITQGDDLFVGKALGITALGFYQMAYKISNMPATEITHTISQVTFPAYSKLQDNRQRLINGITRTLKVVSLVTLPISGGILIIAPVFTQTVLGKKWFPMVTALQILCIFGLIRSLGALFGPVYRAKGRPDIPLRFNIVEIIILVATIYPLSIKWGFTGTSLAVSISALPILFLTGKYMSSLLETDFRTLFRPVLKPFLATIVMMILMAITLKFVPIGGIVLLGLGIFIGVISYLSVIFIFAKEDLAELIRMVKNVH